MTDAALLSSINDAVLDLQNANSSSYFRPLKVIAELLRDDRLGAFNQQIEGLVPLDEFLESQGQHSLDLPVNKLEFLSVVFQLIQKFAADPETELFQFGYTYLGRSGKVMDNVRSVTSQLIVPFWRDYQRSIKEFENPRVEVRRKVEGKKIFLVHGHDHGAKNTVARFLEQLEFEVVILHELPNKGRTIIEKVEEEGDVGYAVVLLTPDDVGSAAGGELVGRARQNVILELGYFIGRISRPYVFSLKIGEVDIPSDFAGVLWVDMDQAGAWKQSLAHELSAAGYDVPWKRLAGR